MSLVEDDDRTEAYREGERRITWLRYDDAKRELTIEAADGDYAGAPEYRDISINVIEPGSRWALPKRRAPVNRTERVLLGERPDL